MSQFVYLYRGWQAPGSPEDMQRQVKNWSAWFKELAAQGNLKDRGFPLERGGKIVRGKDKFVTDGPYTEAKDFVGGYSLIEAKDLEEAVRLAKGCPNFGTGGFVEVRPVLGPNV
jgi:hypothetical protein